MRSWRYFTVGSAILALVIVSGCKTKADLRREHELEKLKQEVNTVRGDRADIDVVSEEIRTELSRVTAVLSEREQYQEKQFEQLREEITALQTRLQAIEQKIVSDEMESVKAPQKSVSRKESTREGNLEAGKKAYEDGDFDNAIEFLKGVANGNSTNPDSRKALYLLAESYYGARDFATAAIEFGEYKQLYPKDPLVPTAIYRQANAFRNLGKTKEAKLFYQELIDRHAKHPLVAKAKQEMKKLAAK